MNILSFDIEEWYIEKKYGSGSQKKYDEFYEVLSHILESLNKYKLKATFFCLGKIAIDFPHVVKRIAADGHEIGSHSFEHKWINKMTPKEFMCDTYDSIAALEDVSGQKIVSYRAPAFSIGEQNKWAIEILAENGIINDASIFPGVRDFGGFPSFKSLIPCKIEYQGSSINEFPIPLYDIPLIHKNLAFSGGGYFRFIPIRFVMNQIEKRDYIMCYFHIGDLLHDKVPMMSKCEYERYFLEKGLLPKRIIRYIKSNIGRTKAHANLDKILSRYPFIPIWDYPESMIEKKIIV